MLISRYYQKVVRIINRFVDTGLIVEVNSELDSRSDRQGVVSGRISFANGDILYFKEYIDTKYRVEKLSYSYHFQNDKDILIFRYDNASHRPALGFRNHKHTKEGIERAQIPEISDILKEILDFLKGWT